MRNAILLVIQLGLLLVLGQQIYSQVTAGETVSPVTIAAVVGIALLAGLSVARIMRERNLDSDRK